VDNNSSDVRFTYRKILKVMKLNNLPLFKSSVDRLLRNLDSYPQVCFILGSTCLLYFQWLKYPCTLHVFLFHNSGNSEL